LSISNIIAVALLSGSPNCPPVAEAVIQTEDRSVSGQITAQPPMPTLTGQDETTIVQVTGTVPSTIVTAPIEAREALTDAHSAGEPVSDTSPPATLPSANPGLPTEGNDEIIVVTAGLGPPPGDPMEAVNEVAFGAVQSVDKAVIAPVADGYQQGIPEPIRDGVHNVLGNLNEPVVFLNFLLQFKIGKAFETAGRFAINSTLGVAGLFDIAKKEPFKLPKRSNGLANTLGFYGVGPGPYMYLPLIGSTTVRDLAGRFADMSVLPTAIGKPFTDPVVAISKGVLSSIDERVENDKILTQVQQSGNPYAAMREYYLKKRQAEIDVLKGKRCNADINLDELEFMDSLPAATSKPVTQSPAPQPN
jgi:phospholipid-binding lipoprotein MlaA